MEPSVALPDSIRLLFDAFKARLKDRELLDAENRNFWTTARRRTYGRYLDILASYRDKGLPPSVLADAEPDLVAAAAEAHLHSERYRSNRDQIFEDVLAAQRQALAALGAFLGEEAVSRMEADVTITPLEAMIWAYGAGTRLRVGLDGGKLAFDPDGPFTKAFLQVMALHRGSPFKGKRLLDVAAVKIRQPAYCRARVNAATLAQIQSAAMPADADTSMEIELVIADDFDAERVLTLLRAPGNEIIAIQVADPTWRNPGRRGMDGVPAAELTADEIAGERLRAHYERDTKRVAEIDSVLEQLRPGF